MATRFRMVGRLAVAALAGGLLLAASPGPAAAQFYFFGGPFYRPFAYRPPVYAPPVMEEELSSRQITGLLQRQGFRDLSRPTYREDLAMLTGTDRHGRRLRLAVDIFTGRIVDAASAPQPRQRLAQRSPDQGAAVRRAIPESRRETSAPAERSLAPRPPTTVRREPILPPQPQQATPPRQPAPSPPTAKVEPAPAQPGTRAQPRRIDNLPPPASLDDVRPPIPAPTGPPINSVPPAPLE